MIETRCSRPSSWTWSAIWGKVREATAAVAESECARREIRADHQGILSGADDPVWRGVIADRDAQLRRALSHGAQSPGVGQPTHQPSSGPSWKRRRGPAAPAPGWHAELLLPRRGLSF